MPPPKKGDFIIGGTHPAEDPRRARVRKGQFMTVDGPPARQARVADKQLAREYPEFADTIKSAGSLSGFELQKAQIAELARRFALLKAQLDAQRGKKK